jgi:hypothetical protein
MTNSSLKKQIRARMEKTGESYQVARRVLTSSPEAAKPIAPPELSEYPPLPTGWKGFGARVVDLIELAEAEARESTERDSRLGGDVTANAIDSIRNRPPAYLALLAAVQAFDDADTKKLLALMYAGREKESLRTMHRTVGLDTPDIQRSVIFSKRGSALPEYLRAGLEAARASSTDLDAPLPDMRLLQALRAAGITDASLDKWDPEFLSLRRISHAISADVEVASRTARENAARGSFALDLGHEAVTVTKEAGETLRAFLVEKGIPFQQRGLIRDWQAKRRLGRARS